MKHLEPEAPRVPVADTPLASEALDLTRRRRILDAPNPPLPAHTRIFTVSNQKGGVGKTTSAVNLASAFARLGARVLVIDLDPQGNASTALSIAHTYDVPGIYDVLVNDVPLSSVLQRSPEAGELYCVPSNINLAGAEIELVADEESRYRLKVALREFLEGSPAPFHYVFIDCPPSLGLLTVNALVAAREVFIPIQCEYYALEGVTQLEDTVTRVGAALNPELRLSTILLTMYDGRTKLAQEVAENVRTHFPAQTLTTIIPRTVRISEAPSYGQTIHTYDPNSLGAITYLEAAHEMANRYAAQTGRV